MDAKESIELIVQAIARLEVQKMGLPLDDENIHYISSLVDRSVIQPLVNYHCEVSCSPDDVVSRFAGLLRGRWLGTGGVFQPAKSAESSNAPVYSPPVARVLPVDQQIIPSATESAPVANTVSVLDIEKSPEPLALSGGQAKRLPVGLDNHSQIILGSGLFRAMNRRTSNHYKPTYPRYEMSETIHHLQPGAMVVRRHDGSSTDYRHMRLSGPMLNADIDCKTYLCLIGVLAQLTESAYEDAANKSMTLTGSEFYRPLKDVLSPDEYDNYIFAYKKTSRVAGALDRLNKFQMTFFENGEDAAFDNQNRAHKGSQLSVGLVSMIELVPSKDPNKEGIVRIRPNRELREMYLAVNKLIAVNRASLLSLDYQLASPMALWLTSLGKQYKGAWVMVNQDFSVEEILKHIHPISQKHYHGSYISRVEKVLRELVDRGLLRCAIKTKLSSRFEVIPVGRGATVNLNSINDVIRIIGHQLSNKNTPTMSASDFEDESLDDEFALMAESKRQKLDTPKEMHLHIVDMLQRINFRTLKTLGIEALAGIYRDTLEQIIDLLRALEVCDRSLLRRCFTSVITTRRGRILSLFEAGLDDEKWRYFKDHCDDFWGSLVVENAKEHDDPIKSLVAVLPKASEITDYKEWQREYQEQLGAILGIIKSSKGPVVSGVYARTLKARLVEPLENAGMQREAELVKRANFVKR